jgi:hypothetical protein
VSEQKSEPISADLSAETMPAMAAAEVESPRIAPDQEETSPKADIRPNAPKVEAKIEPKIEPKSEPKIEAPKAGAAKPDAPRGKVLIMSPADRSGDQGNDSKVEAEPRRHAFAMVAVIALAAIAGALGGALATAGFGHFAGNDTATVRNVAAEASVARLDADILALKASVEQNAKSGISQINKTSDRLDKVEKAQAEPAAKLARLSEAVEKLRAAQTATVAAATPVAAPVATASAAATPVKEVTGSVAPPAAAAAAPAAPAKPEVARLPTVEGWVLRDVGRGGAGALIESRRGIFEVYPGEPVPGLGRVDAIRKQDGRWVVVTSKGLIVAR